MTPREWKYLRHQYRVRKGHFGYSFTSFTIDHDAFDCVKYLGSNYPENFAMMLPTESYKPNIRVKPYRTLSEKRFNLPIEYN